MFSRGSREGGSISCSGFFTSVLTFFLWLSWRRGRKRPGLPRPPTPCVTEQTSRSRTHILQGGDVLSHQRRFGPICFLPRKTSLLGTIHLPTDQSTNSSLLRKIPRPQLLLPYASLPSRKASPLGLPSTPRVSLPQTMASWDISSVSFHLL